MRGTETRKQGRDDTLSHTSVVGVAGCVGQARGVLWKAFENAIVLLQEPAAAFCAVEATFSNQNPGASAAEYQP
jgi:hypothetical protein